MICTITVQDEVWCNLTGLTPEHVTSLYNAFGIFVDGYFWMPAFKFSGWNGKTHFFDKSGKTYVRLLDRILPYLEKWGYEIDLIDNRFIYESPTLRASENLFGEDSPIKLRPYQVDAVNTLLEAGSGILLSSTGSGKSLMTAALSHIYGTAGYKIITIVPSSDLVTQTGEWYQKVGLDVGYYSGTTKDLNHQHIVATWQSLQNNAAILESFISPDRYKKFDPNSPIKVVIWDECQSVSASVAQKLLNENGKHIPFRFGCTGTIPKPEADRMTIFSTIGPILKEIPAKVLIEAGYLAKIEIEPIELSETYIDEDFPDYASEKAFLGKSIPRMEMIANLIISKCAIYGNTLVLVNNIQFGKKLVSLIKDATFLYGESPNEVRKEFYDMFEKNDNLIVIASSGIASTGISIDRIFTLVLVDMGKSFCRSIQSLGRGLRKGRDKDSIHVVDIYSKLRWAKKHFKERCKWYSEAGYPVLKKQVLKL